jgi:putative endonuclease
MTVERQINAPRAFIGDYYITGDNRPLFGGDRCAADIGVGALQQGGGMTMLTRAEIGALGERFVARNWRCRYGELDVIAVDPVIDTLVFVEVKTRTGDGFGGLAQAVTAQKARRLRRLAGIWLAAQDQRWAAVRIDVIGVRIGRRRTPELTHLQGVG